MTTIAVKDKIIAADGYITRGNFVSQLDSIKVHKVSRGLLAIAGDCSAVEELIQMVEDDLDTMPTGYNSWQAFLLTDRGKVFTPEPVEDDNGDRVKYVWHEEADTYAIGSGYAFAIGAMKAGKTAKEAVKIACDCDISSGGKIRTWSL